MPRRRLDARRTANQSQVVGGQTPGSGIYWLISGFTLRNPPGPGQAGDNSTVSCCRVTGMIGFDIVRETA
ncbi:hypothetical protein FM112_05235 [Gulosibacter sp. 10]|nr:hypothetical protein FM112_05235 [Gulosibacter sp. 10]